MARAMTPFRKTRVAADYVLRNSSEEATHLRALEVFHALVACEEAMAEDPVLAQERFDELRSALRVLLGDAWIARHAEDAQVRAFLGLDQDTLPADQDETIAALLWERFGPAGTA
ncbi:hypothetical protein RIF23_08485 [Lipingzhangella sp. LS1_29]|uniref:Uncharacterized protein n=1 Tax=Lipingzhangella rawalii TaxID=2055835 RepID=A0ABU2H641_9ACTN|nr:hypothetical protein [Lipingzhangella rawalii]MDS1270330.1 hypothetical protein [Lipingzhangella rawalii]